MRRCSISTGPYIPTLVTHGTLVNLSKPGRPQILTGSEHLIVQGEPLNGVVPGLKSVLQDTLTALPPVEQKRLAGNSYESTCFLYFIVYTMANLRLRSDCSAGARGELHPSAGEDGGERYQASAADVGVGFSQGEVMVIDDDQGEMMVIDDDSPLE